MEDALQKIVPGTNLCFSAWYILAFLYLAQFLLFVTGTISTVLRLIQTLPVLPYTVSRDIYSHSTTHSFPYQTLFGFLHNKDTTQKRCGVFVTLTICGRRTSYDYSRGNYPVISCIYSSYKEGNVFQRCVPGTLGYVLFAGDHLFYFVF